MTGRKRDNKRRGGNNFVRLIRMQMQHARGVIMLMQIVLDFVRKRCRARE
jgi:hypothetical protein